MGLPFLLQWTWWRQILESIRMELTKCRHLWSVVWPNKVIAIQHNPPQFLRVETTGEGEKNYITLFYFKKRVRSILSDIWWNILIYNMLQKYLLWLKYCSKTFLVLSRGAIKYNIKAFGLAIKDLTVAISIDTNCWLGYFNRAVCLHEKKLYFEVVFVVFHVCHSF